MGEFIKGGKLVYTATSYAGYIGIHTGAKPGALSLSINSRFDKTFDTHLLNWLTGKSTASFISFAMRQALEGESSYAGLIQRLKSTAMVGPSYVISAGPDDGAIFTYKAGSTGPIDILTLSSAISNGSYFILQTNYDHWNAPPFFDNRRDPPEDCLRRMLSPSTIDRSRMFWLMSSEPTLNQLT